MQKTMISIFSRFWLLGMKKCIPIRLTNHQRIDIRQYEELGLSSLNTALSFYLEDLEAREKEKKKKLKN